MSAPKKRVVVLAKSQRSLSLLRMVLTLHGYAVEGTHRRLRALELVATCHPHAIVTEVVDAKTVMELQVETRSRMHVLMHFAPVVALNVPESSAYDATAEFPVVAGDQLNMRLMAVLKRAVRRKPGIRSYYQLLKQAEIRVTAERVRVLETAVDAELRSVAA